MYNSPKVAIIGTGPAGLFAGLALTEGNNEYRILQGEDNNLVLRIADPDFCLPFRYDFDRDSLDVDLAFYDAGPPLHRRQCRVELLDSKRCSNCPTCAILFGPSGGGGGSDGKVIHSLYIGGLSDAYPTIADQGLLEDYLQAAWDIYRTAGMHDAIPRDHSSVERVIEAAATHGFQVIADPITHMGSTPFDGFGRPRRLSELARLPGLVGIYGRILRELNKYHRGALFSYNTRIVDFIVSPNDSRRVTHIVDDKGNIHETDYIVLATGRSGNLTGLAERYGVPIDIGRMSVGFRVEVPHEKMAPLTDLLYELKAYDTLTPAEKGAVIERSYAKLDELIELLGVNHPAVQMQIEMIELFDNMPEIRGRTFCMCPHGRIAIENYGANILYANGYSYYGASEGMNSNRIGTDNTNFAIVFDFYFPDNPGRIEWKGESWQNPHEWMDNLAQRAQVGHPGQLTVQTLEDILNGRPTETGSLTSSPSIRPTINAYHEGDFRLEMPIPLIESAAFFMVKLIGFLQQEYGITLDPNQVLLYGPEAKKTALRYRVEDVFSNVVGAGDGLVGTRGILQASASGLIAGRQILERILRERGIEPSLIRFSEEQRQHAISEHEQQIQMLPPFQRQHI
ncbi:hypothetical protein JW930_04620 [Candidatus Woesearchaeota archaeon]|nr:hypothetical protein [Candidatus Woesearchaeota archaeon]